MKKLMLLAAFLLTGACAPVEDDIIIMSSSTDEYIVEKVNPPKHYSINIRRISDDVYFPYVYRSKRCSGWQRFPVGSTVKLERITWRGEGSREITDFRRSDLRKIFCD